MQPRPPPIRKREPRSPPVRAAEARKSVGEDGDGEVFVMDSVDAIPPLSLSSPVPPSQRPQHVSSPSVSAESKAGGWKVPTTTPK